MKKYGIFKIYPLFVLLAHGEVISDFESFSLSPDSYDNNPFPETSFNESGIKYSNHFTDFGTFTAWEGFAVSNMNDPTTPGFANQFANFSGTGHSGDHYAVGFNPARGVAVITLPASTTVNGFYINNTTYGGLSMRDGDAFSKKFGGINGDDPDFLRLSIYGMNHDNQEVGQVDFYLADFRFSDNAQDYIINDWSYVNLSNLGDNVTYLEFEFASSDVGAFGINTPTYFVIDDLNIAHVPEPASMLLLFIGFLAATRLHHLNRSSKNNT